jgi:hypothetical protein
VTLAPLYYLDFDSPALAALVRAYLVIWLAGLDSKERHRMRACRTYRIIRLQLIAIFCVGHPCLPGTVSVTPEKRTWPRGGATETNNSSRIASNVARMTTSVTSFLSR